MVTEDNTYVIKGMPALYPIPDVSVGKYIYDRLRANCFEDEALLDAQSGHSITYRQLLSRTCSLAESLRKRGYNKTTVITICSENSVEFFVPVIAALFLGAPIAPINHNFTQAEMIHALKISKPQIVFCSKQVYPKLLDLKMRLNFIKQVLIIDSPDAENNSMASFVAKTMSRSRPLYSFRLPDIDLDNQVAFIMYSSGTTGLPKGVMITQRNVLIRFMHADDPRLIPQNVKGYYLGFLPFFHAYGLFVGLSYIYKLVKTIVIKRFEENLFLRCIEKYKITGLPLVPPLAIFLAKSPLVSSYDLSSIKVVSCGAAPLSKETEELLKQRLKIPSVRQGYGLSETTLTVTGIPLNEERNGSTGKVLPYILCKIRDPETGKSLGPNQVGEFCVKGPAVMKGYYGDEEATKNAFTSDGWLLTGDLAYYNDEEYFFIVGRLKELIKYKGFQVAPAELEAILLTNPKIKDAAVIGVPDEEAGELPLAFIVAQPHAKITEKEIQEFLADKVSSPKKLRGGVIFIKEIPKNASGKMLRRKLHEMLKTYKAKL